MRAIRQAAGAVVAALVTIAMFAGGPILAWLGADLPTFTVEELDERPIVYWEDGTADVDDVPIEMVLDEPDPEPDPDTPADGNGTGKDAQVAGSEDGASGDASLSVDDQLATDGDTPAGAAAGSDVAQKPRPRPRRTRRSRRKKCIPSPVPEIRQTGGDRWVVQRDVLRKYTRSLARLNSLGWSRSHRDDAGKVDGMKIGGVRCNNDLHRAGIRSGDIVHTVNGHRVKNHVQAMLVYTRVRRDPFVRVEITRRGRRKTLTYRIRG